MSNTERPAFFSPLNIAALIFIIFTVHFALKFNRSSRNADSDRYVELHKGHVNDIMREANMYVPFSLESIDSLRCYQVSYDKSAILFYTYAKDNSLESLNVRTREQAEALADDIYNQFVIVNAYKTTENHGKNVLSEIASGGYPIKIRLYRINKDRNMVDEDHVVDEVTIKAEQYMSRWDAAPMAAPGQK
ncbi:MAG: hypothetical protein J1E29_02225 [Duncaniella sp.]|nr:hypothetical protein [Duncaniella sp.]